MAKTIPSNITEANIHQAVEEIGDSTIPANRASRIYDLVIDNHRYPPKYVLGIANKHANGEELDDRDFTAPQAVAFLRKLGFQVEQRQSELTYYLELIKFIEQEETGDLKTNHYKKSFAGLKVKVSFGSGNKAQIPWIAFLNETDKVQDGIYPVYLYYVEQQLLILAYGVSETNISNRSWKLDEPESITQYFTVHQLGKPVRYGSSFVYKTYDLKYPLNKYVVDEDLLDLIDIYNKTNETPVPITTDYKKQEMATFHLSSFIDALNKTGLSFNSTLVTRLVSSLLTKPFVILTGLSGSGKTKLAQAFVQWLCKDEQQYCIVPVGADWTNREPLLGYPNALNQQEYVKPDNGALDVIIRANHNPDEPHFLILDEMNLSHVERYFADFLSAMESHEAIALYSGKEKASVPNTIKWPTNLFVIGTVNIDETTNMFSPKVLDRANTIEFRVTDKEMTDFLKETRSIDMRSLFAAGGSMAVHFVQLAASKSLPTQDVAVINQILVDFFKELRKLGAEFGYRSATEILQLIHQLGVMDATLSINHKLDIAIMQKLLPKLHGSRRKLCPVLVALGKLCIIKTVGPQKGIDIEKDVFEADDFNTNNEGVLYPMSLEKITRMYKGAVDNGFASFAEA